MADEWTIGRLLAWTTEYLAEHGSESARLDAEVLLAHARGCKRIELYTSFDEPAGDALRTKFRELVRRRAEGVPVAYLVGHREFYSLDFHVTPEVLIPRPETEHLVVALLDKIKERAAEPREITLADVGTGSGIIAIAVARHAPRVRVTALDISAAALAVARDNAARLGVADRVELVESDLLTAIEPERRFDFIASNPPYVSTAESASLARDVREHEPKLALEAGETGLAVIERLIPQAADRLASGGSLLLEISPMLQNRVESLLDAEPRLSRGATIKDLAGLARVVVAKRRLEVED
jgi:release factor glutamine methyltransferase